MAEMAAIASGPRDPLSLAQSLAHSTGVRTRSEYSHFSAPLWSRLKPKIGSKEATNSSLESSGIEEKKTSGGR